MSGFDCFPPETAAFLSGIAEHNDKAWFEGHRPLYEAGYVSPARAFVEEMGPRLREFARGVQYDPRINGSISRVNRDTRFSRDKRLYKDHLDLWFWHGEKKGWTQPGFFMRLTAEDVWIGAGMHHFEEDLLTRYRNAVVDDHAGEALRAAIREVQAAGDYQVGGMPRKRVPRGYDKASPRAEYLLWESLPALTRMPISAALAPGFVDTALRHFRNTWPIARWLLEEVTEG